MNLKTMHLRRRTTVCANLELDTVSKILYRGQKSLRVQGGLLASGIYNEGNRKRPYLAVAPAPQKNSGL